MLEATDARAAADFVEVLTAAEAAPIGVRVRREAGVVAVMASRIDVLAYNRVIGLGVAEPASSSRLDDLIGWYRASGVPRFFVQLAPGARPTDLRDWLTARGLAHYNNWVKLHRSTADPPTVVTDLRIERIGSGRAGEFASIVTRGFGLPPAMRPWIAASVGQAGWRQYLAFDGHIAVAAGALYVAGATGWLGFAATDAGHRGRGAQSALVARRISDARTLGCTEVVVETAEDRNEHRAPSFHNLRRLGFQMAYLRANYLWSAPPGDRPAA